MTCHAEALRDQIVGLLVVDQKQSAVTRYFGVSVSHLVGLLGHEENKPPSICNNCEQPHLRNGTGSHMQQFNHRIASIPHRCQAVVRSRVGPTRY